MEFVDKVTAAVVVIIVLGLYELVKAPGGKVSGDTVLGVIIAPAPCSLYLAERFCVIALVPRRGKEFVEWCLVEVAAPAFTPVFALELAMELELPGEVKVAVAVDLYVAGGPPT